MTRAWWKDTIYERILTRKLEREGVASHVREMKALLASSQFAPTYS